MAHVPSKINFAYKLWLGRWIGQACISPHLWVQHWGWPHPSHVVFAVEFMRFVVRLSVRPSSTDRRQPRQLPGPSSGVKAFYCRCVSRWLIGRFYNLPLAGCGICGMRPAHRKRATPGSLIAATRFEKVKKGRRTPAEAVVTWLMRCRAGCTWPWPIASGSSCGCTVEM
jgi:hypothetical protein